MFIPNQLPLGPQPTSIVLRRSQNDMKTGNNCLTLRVETESFIIWKKVDQVGKRVATHLCFLLTLNDPSKSQS